MAEFLTPIVRWAQNGPTIDLTVDLIDVKKPKIVLDETTLEFQGFGHGAQGENIYQFNLEFFRKIDYKDSNYKVTERNVSFKLKKQVKGEEWPRLLKSEQKPGWLKIDFDKLRLEDSDKEEEDETERINKISFEQRIKSDVEKAKNDLGIYTRVAWLTIYNLFQAVCFMIILFKLLYNLYQHGKDYRKSHKPHWNLPVPRRYNHIHRIGHAARGYDDLEYVWLIDESEYNQLRGRENRPYVGRKQHLRNPSGYVHYNDHTGNDERKGLGLRRKNDEQVNFKTLQPSKAEKQNVSSSGNSVKTDTAGDVHDNVNLSSKYKHTDEQDSSKASHFKNASKTKKKAAANAQQEARVEKEEGVLVGKEIDKADGNTQDAGYKVEKEKTTKEEGSTGNEEEDDEDFLDNACKKITECVADVHEKCRHLFDRRISICAVPMNHQFSKKKVINVGELCKGKPLETWIVVRNFEHGTRFLDQKSISGVYCGTLDGQKVIM